MDEASAYKWARQALRPVENGDVLEPYKYQQIADKIVAAILAAYELGRNEKSSKGKSNQMTEEQKYKLRKTAELIADSMKQYQGTSPKIISVWLSVAGDYCHEVAKEMIKDDK